MPYLFRGVSTLDTDEKGLRWSDGKDVPRQIGVGRLVRFLESGHAVVVPLVTLYKGEEVKRESEGSLNRLGNGE